MENEIDKEMDAILRQAAKGGGVVNGAAFDSHPDADEISMFAENALPEKAKPKFIKHLADCDRCRIILANTIDLNSEAGEKAASVAVGASGKEVAAIPEVPWYRKILETRSLAFGLGGLALIFAAMIGFIAVQNALQTGTSEMAKATRDSAADSNLSADRLNEVPSSQDISNANTNAVDGDTEAPDAESPVPADAETATEPVKGPNAKDVGPDAQKAAEETGRRSGDRKDKSEKEADDADEGFKNQPARDRTKEEKLKVAKRNVGLADNKADRNERVSENRPVPAAPPKPVPTPGTKAKPKTSQPVVVGQTKTTESPKNRRERQADSISKGEDKKGAGAYATRTRKISGKTFALKNGVWYDSAYRNQKTTGVKRGTTQYKNLDSGLRAIGDKIKGTVVVVWKRKAYRIQ